MLLEYQFTPAIRTAARNTPSADKAMFRAIASWCQMQAIACLLREVGARSEGTGLLGKASWRRWREGEKGLPGKAILSLPQSLTHQPATRQAGTSARRGDLWCPQLTRGAHLQPGAGWRPEGGLGGVKGGGTAPNRGTCVSTTLATGSEEGGHSGNSVGVMTRCLLGPALFCAPPRKAPCTHPSNRGPTGLQPGAQGWSHEPVCRALGLGHHAAIVSYKACVFRM